MKVVFISDLHLCPMKPAKHQVLRDLLSTWQAEIDALYILGDFFDYWLGDDDCNQFTEEIKILLQNFTPNVPTYFIAGNHDFMLGKTFAEQTGITLLADLSVININGLNLLIAHGDAFCSLDRRYQTMKKWLRNPLTLSLLRHLPLSWRYSIKQYLENHSNKAFDRSLPQIYQVVDKTIVDYAKARMVDIVIHGHTHNPGQYSISYPNQASPHDDSIIKRYEIPDWQDRPPGGYIIINDDQITIVNPTIN